jgi:hypothetical protein
METPKENTMEPPKIRLFVSDVDGTLLNAQKELTEATRGAIRRLQSAGIPISLISSRPPQGLKWLIETLDVQHACAALNGGVIIDPKLEVLSERHLRDAVTPEIVGLIEAQNLDPWIYTQKEWYVTRRDAAHVKHEAEVVRFPPKLFGTLDEVDRPIIKITGVSDNSDSIIACHNQLIHKFGSRLSLSCSLPNRLEITHQDANKGTAIDAIGATVNVARNQIATAGDGENDILMFRNSGFSIAMGQAPVEVRRSATETTTSNSQDGLAWAIDEFLLKRFT